jgi:hypothetical protein
MRMIDSICRTYHRSTLQRAEHGVLAAHSTPARTGTGTGAAGLAVDPDGPQQG